MDTTDLTLLADAVIADATEAKKPRNLKRGPTKRTPRCGWCPTCVRPSLKKACETRRSMENIDYIDYELNKQFVQLQKLWKLQKLWIQ